MAKPAAGAGSFAVTRVDTWKELEGATRAFFLEVLPRYLANLGLTEDAAPDALKGMVVEEFIHGNEVRDLLVEKEEGFSVRVSYIVLTRAALACPLHRLCRWTLTAWWSGAGCCLPA